jgi:hypothetical protein
VKVMFLSVFSVLWFLVLGRIAETKSYHTDSSGNRRRIGPWCALFSIILYALLCQVLWLWGAVWSANGPSYSGNRVRGELRTDLSCISKLR